MENNNTNINNLEQNIGLKRDNKNNFDKFYTKSTIVDICIDNIKRYIEIDNDDIIIEPSAGNGSFINSIKELCKNYIFIDIAPEHNDILKEDFLEYDFDRINKKYNNIHIIGNPPFGRQSSTTIKFLKKCKNCNSISFILPKSFKKNSMKKYFPIYFHLILSIDLPNNSFIVNNEEHDVPCVFQIWERKDVIREMPKKKNPINYKFVKKEEDPDISFRRVGVYAGKIDKETEKSEQSHYFIKFNKKLGGLDDIIDKLNNICFETDNTVGPKSISKQEIIKEFNDKLNNK